MEHDLLQSEKGIFECATLNSTKCNSVSIVYSITHRCWHPTSVIVSFLFSHTHLLLQKKRDILDTKLWKFSYTNPHSSWDLLEHRCITWEIILRPLWSLTSCNLELKENIMTCLCMYSVHVQIEEPHLTKYLQ